MHCQVCLRARVHPKCPKGHGGAMDVHGLCTELERQGDFDSYGVCVFALCVDMRTAFVNVHVHAEQVPCLFACRSSPQPGRGG